MKRTDIEKIEREQKKKNKKLILQDKKLQGRNEQRNDSFYITALLSLFQYDAVEVFNIKYSDKILELLLEMQEDIEEKDWDNIFRKAIKKTKVKNKEKAFDDLKTLLK